MIVTKKILLQKNFSHKKNLVTKIESQNFLVTNKFKSQKNFITQKILVTKFF